MSNRYEQHLSDLSNRCFDLIKEQTKKQNWAITALLGIYAFVISYIAGKTIPSDLDYALLIILFVVGILADMFILTITALLNGYKAEHQIISKLIMSDKELANPEQIKQEIDLCRIQQQKEFRFNFVRALSVFNLILLVVIWTPVVLLMVLLGVTDIIVIALLCLAFILFIFFMLIFFRSQMLYRCGIKKKTNSKNNHKGHFWIIDF